MTSATDTGGSIARIRVSLHVGHDRMAGTDDPLFLRLHGPCGREFRLAQASDPHLKRDADAVYVLAAAGGPEATVAHPELNDPTQPPLQLDDVQGVSLVKGMEPIPNVRGIGELDDRLEVASVAVEIQTTSGETTRYARQGPLWLGLACGLAIELARE